MEYYIFISQHLWYRVYVARSVTFDTRDAGIPSYIITAVQCIKPASISTTSIIYTRTIIDS